MSRPILFRPVPNTPSSRPATTRPIRPLPVPPRPIPPRPIPPVLSRPASCLSRPAPTCDDVVRDYIRYNNARRDSACRDVDCRGVARRDYVGAVCCSNARREERCEEQHDKQRDDET